MPNNYTDEQWKQMLQQQRMMQMLNAANTMDYKTLLGFGLGRLLNGFLSRGYEKKMNKPIKDDGNQGATPEAASAPVNTPEMGAGMNDYYNRLGGLLTSTDWLNEDKYSFDPRRWGVI